MSSLQPEVGLPRNVKFVMMVAFIYIMVINFFTLIIPDSDLPVITEPLLFSWVLIVLMPLMIPLIYGFYRFYSKRTDLNTLMGPAISLYMFSIVPSIYAFIIGILDVILRPFAIPFGLVVSLIGYGFVCHLLPKLNETIQTTNQ